jgi:hypothetical protein
MLSRAALSLAAFALLQAPVVDPAPIIAGAREALGGESRLGAIKTIVITGRTRQVQGNNLVPIEFEIACELPDKCIRRDEIPARESGPTTIGFNGDELIQVPVPGPLPEGRGGPPPGRDGGPPPSREGGPPPGRDGGAPGRGVPPSPEAQRAARLATVKQDFARLFFGMFAAPPANFAVTFAYAGEAEAPQGRADVLNVKGPGTFNGRFFVFKDSRLPVMFTWQGPSPTGPAENRLFYADYRDVDGMKFPFRLRRAVGADTVEETIIDRFRVNTRIDARRFEVRK